MGLATGPRRSWGPGLTHQCTEGHDAEQPLQEDAETVHERAALTAARPGRDRGGRPSRQSAAHVPSRVLHGGLAAAREEPPGLAAARAAPPSRDPGPGARSRYLSPLPPRRRA